MTQILIFPAFGLHTTLAQNLKMGAVLTLVSIARSFALRRLFEAIRLRGSGPTKAGFMVSRGDPVDEHYSHPEEPDEGRADTGADAG